jgi:hypothetical protein
MMLAKSQIEKPPSLNEHQDYQAALMTLTNATEAHRRAAQARREWEARCNHSDDAVRAVAALERPNVDRDFWKTRIAMDEAQKACDAARGQAKADVEAARLCERLPLVREVIERLQPALDAVERLNAFDLETERRGGARLLPPFPSLIGDLTGGVRWQIERLRQEILS